jgi:hypothetical protein
MAHSSQRRFIASFAFDYRACPDKGKISVRLS